MTTLEVVLLIGCIGLGMLYALERGVGTFTDRPNRRRRFGSWQSYVWVKLRTGWWGFPHWHAMTGHDVATTRERANKNPEDVPND